MILVALLQIHTNIFQASIMLSSSKRFKRSHRAGVVTHIPTIFLFQSGQIYYAALKSVPYIEYPAIFGSNVDIRGVSVLLAQIVFIHLRTSVDDTV